MKRTIASLAAAFLLTPVIALASEQNPFDKPLPFKSAKVTYSISGMEEGTETLYLDDYGRKSAAYHKTVTSMMGMKLQNSTVEITDPEWVYSYDLVERTGVKGPNMVKYLNEEYQQLSKAEKKVVSKNAEHLGCNVMSGMGGEIEQNATEILGYSCDRVSAMGVTVYSLHGTSLPLQTDSSTMGMKMAMVATSVEEGKVEEKHFQHPEGIEAIFDPEADAMARQMAAQTIAWLKDPEASNGSPGQMDAAGQTNRMQHIPAEDQEAMQQAMEALKGMFGNQQ